MHYSSCWVSSYVSAHECLNVDAVRNADVLYNVVAIIVSSHGTCYFVSPLFHRHLASHCSEWLNWKVQTL